jgi:uncharacterized protein YbcV (DUF1398 family)
MKQVKNLFGIAIALAIVVSMTVSLAGCSSPTDSAIDQTPTADDYDIGELMLTASDSAAIVTVTPKQGKSPGTVTVYYEGIDGTTYEKSTTPPTAVGKYAVTFNVAAATGWKAAKGLPAGTLIIEPSIPAAGNFVVNGLSQIYDGTPKPVTVTFKEGKSGGEITIYYEGTEGTVYEKSTTPPTEVGKYAVTIDVAAAPGWKAASGLSVGTLEIGSQIANPQTPVADDFDIGKLSQAVGSVSAVTIEPKPGKSDGVITIYYEGTDGTVYAKSDVLPTAVGKYEVTFDVAAAIGWEAATGLYAGTLIINEVPTADDFDIGNLTQIAGSVSPVTIEPKAGKSSGAVTIYYNGSKTLPTAEGSYAVTFDVAAASGWEAASGLPAGTLTINPLLIAYVRDRAPEILDQGPPIVYKDEPLYYYINQFGQDIFSKRFNNAGSFAEGLAAVRDENISGTYYYIKPDGSEAFPSQRYYSAGSFREGVAIVTKTLSQDIDHPTDGYIKIDGSDLFGGDNFTYYYPTSFSEGLVYVRYNRDDKFRYKDKSGNDMFSSKTYSTASSFSEGLAYVKDNLTDSYYYYIKPDGSEAFPSKRYYTVNSFSEGLAAVRDENVGGSYYYIDTSGNAVSSKKYYTANSFSGGLAVVRDSSAANQYYYINKSGQDVFSKKYFSASSFSNGLAYVREFEGGKYGYIKEDGSNLYAENNFRYDTANSFSAAGLAAAKIGDFWGYIKKDGSNLFEEDNFRYFSASTFAKVE